MSSQTAEGRMLVSCRREGEDCEISTSGHNILLSGFAAVGTIVNQASIPGECVRHHSDDDYTDYTFCPVEVAYDVWSDGVRVLSVRLPNGEELANAV